MIIAKKGKDLRPVVMKGARVEVQNPYYLIEDGQQLIFVVSPGKNGAEFNKTIGYFSNFSGMQTYQCLYGQGLILMQRIDEMGEAKEFKVVSLNPPGRQVLVPAGWGMCVINTGINYLIVLRYCLGDEEYEDIKPILEKGGFAYFVVEKKGEISFEENPSYSFHPQITTE